MAAIEEMKLYQQVERVFNELAALGYGEHDPLPASAVAPFDQYHYLGTEAVDHASEALRLSAASRVLEIGSGIGGPARHLASSIGCNITALELQPDLNLTAASLTRRCGLDSLVDHVCGDALDPHAVDVGAYEAVVSWLAFLHIPDRPTLYRRCFDSLTPGGGLFVEDYFARGELTDDERRTLASDVFCEHVPTMEEYRGELAAVGFESVEMVDLSESWTAFVQERLDAFRQQRDAQVALHGVELVEGLDHFYSSVESLFAAGNLGGVRLLARRPA